MGETTTIRLPPKLRARIHALAKQSGRSAHGFILEAVERHADYEEQMRSLVKEALAADEELGRTAEVYRADDVHAWVDRLARSEGAARAACARRHSGTRDLIRSDGVHRAVPIRRTAG